MPEPIIRITNRQFRRALLGLNGLSSPSTDRGPDWAHDMVSRLGFVQVDSIAAVERAQHHILFSRNPRYRQDDLVRLLERDRRLFEHWTHDAAILPVELYPYWKHYFERAKSFEAHPGYRRYFAPVTTAGQARVLRRIRRDGAVRPSDFGTRRPDWRDPRFNIPTIAKITLEYLWRTGKLAVTRREGREKVYDLAERVIPKRWFSRRVSRAAYVDWTCRAALERLGAASPTRVARFFDALSRQDVESWRDKRRGKDVVEVRVVQADGSLGPTSMALVSFVERLRDFPAPPRGLRLINPFDPLIYDRRRTLAIFGFEYAVEIWVPPNRRRYGYFVLPVLEGQRFTGRIDVKADRGRDTLRVLGLWWEAGVETGAARMSRLERELQRLARFAGVSGVTFTKGVAAT